MNLILEGRANESLAIENISVKIPFEFKQIIYPNKEIFMSLPKDDKKRIKNISEIELMSEIKRQFQIKKGEPIVLYSDDRLIVGNKIRVFKINILDLKSYQEQGWAWACKISATYYDTTNAYPTIFRDPSSTSI